MVIIRCIERPVLGGYNFMGACWLVIPPMSALPKCLSKKRMID